MLLSVIRVCGFTRSQVVAPPVCSVSTGSTGNCGRRHGNPIRNMMGLGWRENQAAKQAERRAGYAQGLYDANESVEWFQGYQVGACSKARPRRRLAPAPATNSLEAPLRPEYSARNIGHRQRQQRPSEPRHQRSRLPLSGLLKYIKRNGNHGTSVHPMAAKAPNRMVATNVRPRLSPRSDRATFFATRANITSATGAINWMMAKPVSIAPR